MVGQKKFNPNQPTWVGLNPWVGQILLLLLNWVEKKNINILKKAQSLVSMLLLKGKQH